MAHCETVAWGQCDSCSGKVAVKRNRSGLAYYRCDHCGVQTQHHWKRSSDAMLRGLGVAEAPEGDKPAPAPAKKKAEGLAGLFSV